MTEVAISGAGIGGLVTALCLKNKGFNVKVFEADTEIRALGVGINIMPHASKLLIQLGLGPQLDALGVQTRCIEYRTKFGHLIQSDPRSIEAGFEAPQYSIHRGELQAMLASEVEKQLGNSSIKLNKPVVGFRQGDNTVTILFKDGSEFNIDLLIDATGLHSKIRKQMNPNEGPLCYEGTMMFRGAVETDAIGDGKTMVIAGDHDVKFVTYPISEHARQSGCALTNWVAEVRHSEPRHINDADWGRGATLDFIKPFKDLFVKDGALSDLVVSIKVPYLHQLIQKLPPVVPEIKDYDAIYKFDWLSATGTAIMLAALITIIYLKMKPKEAVSTFFETVNELKTPIYSIGMVLAFAFIANYSGLSATLALALAHTGQAFTFFSPFLGWVGVFLTGSDTSANALAS